MRRVIIGSLVVLSLVFAVSAFAEEVSQPVKDTGLTISFEQMKEDHLKKLDERINNLQQEKVCVQAAKNKDDIMACRMKHKADMKDYHEEMRKMGSHGHMGGQVPPQVK